MPVVLEDYVEVMGTSDTATVVQNRPSGKGRSARTAEVHKKSPPILGWRRPTPSTDTLGIRVGRDDAADTRTLGGGE